MTAFLWLPDYLWHPYAGRGYQFWSGIGSDIGELSIVASVAATGALFWRRHNCHVQRCWRLQWHEHPENGHPVCRKHHPVGPLRSPS